MDHDHDREVARFGECITCQAGQVQQGSAQVAARQAMAVAYRGAPADWLRKAQDAVRQLADQGQEFTTDEVWARVPPPPEPRAIGVVMRWAAESGLVVNTKRHRSSRRPGCHARPVTVWAPSTSRLV